MGCSASVPGFSVAYLGLQPCKPHEPIHAIMTTPLSIFPEILMDLPVAIYTTRLQPELLDQSCQTIIGSLASGLGLLSPSVITAGMDFQQITEPADRPQAAVISDEGVPHSG